MRKLKIKFNSPVVLGFVFLCMAVTLLGAVTEPSKFPTSNAQSIKRRSSYSVMSKQRSGLRIPA